MGYLRPSRPWDYMIPIIKYTLWGQQSTFYKQCHTKLKAWLAPSLRPVFAWYGSAGILLSFQLKGTEITHLKREIKHHIKFGEWRFIIFSHFHFGHGRVLIMMRSETEKIKRTFNSHHTHRYEINHRVFFTTMYYLSTALQGVIAFASVCPCTCLQ